MSVYQILPFDLPLAYRGSPIDSTKVVPSRRTRGGVVNSLGSSLLGLGVTASVFGV